MRLVDLSAYRFTHDALAAGALAFALLASVAAPFSARDAGAEESPSAEEGSAPEASSAGDGTAPEPPAAPHTVSAPSADPNRSIVEDSDLRIWDESPIGTISYRPARGIRFGDTGLQIGGFSTLEFERLEHEPYEFAWDSINFLVLYEPIERFRIFADLEIGDLAAVEESEPAEFGASFNTERLYGELSLSDRFNLRFGKFQTPIGRWNLVPAEPFVWTASTPILLETAIDEHQTGVSLQGTLFPSAGAVDYWIYGQVMDPLDPSESPRPLDRSVGARLEFTRPTRAWSVGGSFLASDQAGEWSTLAGLDLELHAGPFELLTEALYQGGRIPDRDIAAIFVQGRLELLRGFHLVTRYEFFSPLGANRDPVHVGDFGFAWQPFDWLIGKATYRVSDRDADDVERGLTTSLSVVF